MGGFGQGMLERMGWRKGDGLGKEKQGRAVPIQLKKKDDTKGLGGRFDWDWSQDYASSAFDEALAGVAAGSDSPSSASNSSDDELDESARNYDGTISTASGSERKLARELARDNNLGRFGARAGKLARIREQEELLAAASRARASASEAIATPSNAVEKGTAAAQARSRNVIIVQLAGFERQAVPPEPPAAPAADWWGSRRFQSAGWLGSIDAESEARQSVKFDEGTQTAIFTRLTEQQSKVRRVAQE